MGTGHFFTLLHFALSPYIAKCNNVMKSKKKNESVCFLKNTAVVDFEQKNVFWT